MERSLILFEGARRIAAGPEAEIRALLRSREETQAAAGPRLAVFEADTGRITDLDLREDRTEPPPRPRGRPKLGVTAREVTLLPRDWDWLARQPGGASATLRRLVEAARRNPSAADRMRARREAAYRMLTELAGDRPGYEEAMRALFRGDAEAFAAATEGWPRDLIALFPTEDSE